MYGVENIQDLIPGYKYNPNPSGWTVFDLYEFTKVFSGLREATILKKQEVDGESFLLMNTDNLLKVGILLGPAKKLEAAIIWLRQFS